MREASEADKCLEMRERAQREREGERRQERPRGITEAEDQRRHQTNNPSKEPISLSFYPGTICSGVGLKKKKHGIRGSLGFYLDGSMENRSRRRRKERRVGFILLVKRLLCTQMYIRLYLNHILCMRCSTCTYINYHIYIYICIFHIKAPSTAMQPRSINRSITTKRDKTFPFHL